MRAENQNKEKVEPSTLALLIEYDGHDFVGWQNQPNGISVQSVLERSIENIFGVRVPVIGSGRTDTGVHARGQVAHVVLPPEANNIPPQSIPKALNSRLPSTVQILDASYQGTFHARYDAISREYKYHIALRRSVFTQKYAWHPPLPFDVNLLGAASEVFCGTHNFTTVSKHNADTTSYICTVSECSVAVSEIEALITIRANRFVYGMCRGIVGAMMGVARRHSTVDQIREGLAAENRGLHSGMVPACGLYLHRVYYNTQIFPSYQHTF